MLWLVVGANGQLGNALSKKLKENQKQFCTYSSSDLDIRFPYESLEKICEFKPDIIINAAAWTDVDSAESNSEKAYLVNADGALNLAKASKAVGAVYIHVSTDYVFSGFGSVPWSESDPMNPISEYGKSKAAGEIAVLNEYAQKSYIFRTAWIYSRWGKNFAKTMVRQALFNDVEVKVVDDQIGQPTSALDLAQQIISTVEAKLPYGIYHATNSGQVSWFEFAREIFRLCDGVSVERVVRTDSSSFVRAAKRPAYSVLGHEAWKAVGKDGLSVAPMRDWKIALREAIPEIISAVKAEGK